MASQHAQLKPHFYLFQRVQDQLYLAPPTVLEHTSLTWVYFGTLGFTKPLEKLVLCTVPLQSLLDWLFKPKGPNLVEASMAAAPDKALALVVTNRMLYGEKPPLVGVGLVYKPHKILWCHLVWPTCICMYGTLLAPTRSQGTG